MGSVNIMGNTDTLKITKGQDKIKLVSTRGSYHIIAVPAVPVVPYTLLTRNHQNIHRANVV